MRRIAGTAFIALLLAIAPAGVAFSQTTEQTNTTTATVQAQDTKDDDSNDGLWGLFGLLGLAGLIPWRKTSQRQPHQDTTRSTGM